MGLLLRRMLLHPHGCVGGANLKSPSPAHMVGLLSQDWLCANRQACLERVCKKPNLPIWAGPAASKHIHTNMAITFLQDLCCAGLLRWVQSQDMVFPWLTMKRDDDQLLASKTVTTGRGKSLDGGIPSSTTIASLKYIWKEIWRHNQ